MRYAEAQIIANGPAWGSLVQLTMRAPILSQSTATGHFVIVRCSSGRDPLLPRAFWLSDYARQLGDISLLYTINGAGTRWLSERAVGASLNVLGPCGAPFTIDDKSRRMLLIGEGRYVAPLLGFAADLSRRGLAATLVTGARMATELPPAAVVPPEVEYVTATDDGSAGYQGSVLDVSRAYIGWADQIFACLPEHLYGPLQEVVRRTTLRWRPGLAQVLVEGIVPCGVGACDGCLMTTRRGARRLCRDGPTFDLHELLL